MSQGSGGNDPDALGRGGRLVTGRTEGRGENAMGRRLLASRERPASCRQVR